jgi:polysaccharide deacetylase family protein (PEP-CTERM system associated)
MINLLSVDVEDWQQSTLDNSLPISKRALTNTLHLLDLLLEYGVQGTFFVQSMVAEKYPQLVHRIVSDGHELASHGHSHIPLFRLTPVEFEQDLRHSLKILNGLSAQSIQGYRAPDFSIRRDTMWALEILRDQGFKYSSSIFPIRGHRYGIHDIPLRQFETITGLIEVPLSTVSLAGRNWPVAGGGYFRLFPYWLTKRAIRRMNADERQAIVYLHPYELDSH